MSRLLDLDQKEADWLREIENYKSKVQEYDKAIAHTIALKQEATEEIEKRNRWIHTAREMFGINTSDLEQNVSITAHTETLAGQILKMFEDLKIPEAVEKLLQECAPEKLTVTEMAKRLKASGIKTESTDFRNVLQNRLFSMRKKPDRYRWLNVEKKEGDNYYSYKN